MNFADKLQNSINSRKSHLVAGFDPQLDAIPKLFLEKAAALGQTTDESIYAALFQYYSFALDALNQSVAAIKPNIAFFEQYGIAGLRAFRDICLKARDLKLPVIADAKRGDIDTTARAYSKAFLGVTSAFGKSFEAFPCDALTLNPLLGFETLKPFTAECLANGKGVFVMVQTSNPGANDIENEKTASGQTICEKIAAWIAANSLELSGDCGYSALGAVVGATKPQAAKALRALMPNSLFLIPGLGAQGASALDAVQGFGLNPKTKQLGGAVINVSRGIFGFKELNISLPDLEGELKKRASDFNASISAALKQFQNSSGN